MRSAESSGGQRKRLRSAGAFVVCCVLLASSSSVWAIDRIEPKPKDLEKVGVTERLDEQVPLDIPFVESSGTPVTLAQYFDGKRPVILTLNYSNCARLCSLQLNGVFEALQRLDWDIGDKFQMITVSIDPEESPQRAQATKEKYLAVYNRPKAEEGWHCLVGKEPDIQRLAAAVGFGYVYVPETKQFAHTAVTMILTPTGRVSRYLYGIEYNPQTLRFALLEASQGKIGTTVERLLLNCYYYDAEAGRYGPAAVKIVRLGGVVTLVVLGSVLAVFWRREWRKTKHAGGSSDENAVSPASEPSPAEP